MVILKFIKKDLNSKKLDKYFNSLQSDAIKVPNKFTKLLKENNIKLD